MLGLEVFRDPLLGAMAWQLAWIGGVIALFHTVGLVVVVVEAARRLGLRGERPLLWGGLAGLLLPVLGAGMALPMFGGLLGQTPDIRLWGLPVGIMGIGVASAGLSVFVLTSAIGGWFAREAADLLRETVRVDPGGRGVRAWIRRTLGLLARERVWSAPTAVLVAIAALLWLGATLEVVFGAASIGSSRPDLLLPNLVTGPSFVSAAVHAAVGALLLRAVQRPAPGASPPSMGPAEPSDSTVEVVGRGLRHLGIRATGALLMFASSVLAALGTLAAVTTLGLAGLHLLRVVPADQTTAQSPLLTLAAGLAGLALAIGAAAAGRRGGPLRPIAAADPDVSSAVTR